MQCEIRTRQYRAVPKMNTVFSIPRLLIQMLAVAVAMLVLAPNALSQEIVLYSFGSAPDGNYPSSSLTFDHAGHLYGTTYGGGAHSAGAVYSLIQRSGQWAEGVIYNFCQQSNCADGSQPYSTLVFDTVGNLYGTTYAGGIYGGGVVFKLTRNAHGAWAETVIHSFGHGTDGAYPLAGLIFDKTGNLYGTTGSGGSSTSSCFGGCGTVYELSPGSNGEWTESVLYNFCSQSDCSDGNSPESSVVLDSAGDLFGTTTYGGNLLVDGTVFELSPLGNGQWAQTTLHRFLGGSDGYNPHAGVVLDRAGNLYGTTVNGGIDGNNGTVFKLTRGANGQWTEKVIYTFCAQFECTDGSEPYAGVTFDKSGNLYGATSGGGSDWGLVYKLTPSEGQWTEAVLHAFAGLGIDGVDPVVSVTFDATGQLYGVAGGGIGSGYGLIFELTH
jgi:uncharacterized repeat protein (TIGR03803 family)